MHDPEVFAALRTLFQLGIGLYAEDDGTLYDVDTRGGDVDGYYAQVQPLLRRYAAALWQVTRALGAPALMTFTLGRDTRHLGPAGFLGASTHRHAVDVQAPCGHLLRRQFAARAGETWCVDCARENRPL